MSEEMSSLRIFLKKLEDEIYERGKADGIREGMERAAGILENWQSELLYYEDGARAIRQSAKETK